MNTPWIWCVRRGSDWWLEGQEDYEYGLCLVASLNRRTIWAVYPHIQDHSLGTAWEKVIRSATKDTWVMVSEILSEIAECLICHAITYRLDWRNRILFHGVIHAWIYGNGSRCHLNAYDHIANVLIARSLLQNISMSCLAHHAGSGWTSYIIDTKYLAWSFCGDGSKLFESESRSQLNKHICLVLRRDSIFWQGEDHDVTESWICRNSELNFSFAKLLKCSDWCSPGYDDAKHDIARFWISEKTSQRRWRSLRRCRFRLSTQSDGISRSRWRDDGHWKKLGPTAV